MPKKLIPIKQGGPNDFQTPKIAIKPLLPYLKKDWIIWECAAGKGNLVNAFVEKGFNIIKTDIISGQDFLTYQPQNFDCIITNPPFSLKQQFIERCYLLGKPFALLLPLTTLETKKRQNLFKKYGVELILFDKRINFETPDGMSSPGSYFATMWVCWGLNIGKQLNFVDL